MEGAHWAQRPFPKISLLGPLWDAAGLNNKESYFLSLKFQPFGTFITRNISAEIFSVTLAYPYSQLEYKINKNAVTVRDSQKHNKKPNETK